MSKNEETPWYCDVFAVNSIRTLDRKLSRELWIIYILLWDSCEEKIRWFFPTNSSQSGDHDWKISFVLNLVRFSTLVTFALKLHMWIHKKGQDKTLNLTRIVSCFSLSTPSKGKKMMLAAKLHHVALLHEHVHAHQIDGHGHDRDLQTLIPWASR